MGFSVDAALVAIIYLYVFSLIALVHFLRSKLGLSSKATRHAIHIFAGDSILSLPLFSSWWYPFTLPLGLSFMVGLGLMRGGAFRGLMVEESEYSRLHVFGPLYYVISTGLLVPLTWGFKPVGMAAVMIMAWGDGAAAALAPRIQSRHRYPFSDKSMEGSLIMLLFAFLGSILAWMVAAYAGATPMEPYKILRIAFAGAAAGTIVEALSIGPLKPFDNFTVPLISALTMRAML
ncbi:MAG: diacylglycerol/polyprenol kinase family protein [Candidatus Bathyarchaeia archaeon]